MVDDYYDYSITDIYLNNANLVGTIPPEIYTLRGLKSLDLCSNYGLIGSIPSEIGLLTNLHDLHIQKTNIQGTIPTILGHLTSLNRLLIDETKITGIMPQEVCELKQIENGVLGSLNSIHANCSGQPYSIQCNCCDKC